MVIAAVAVAEIAAATIVASAEETARHGANDKVVPLAIQLRKPTLRAKPELKPSRLPTFKAKQPLRPTNLARNASRGLPVSPARRVNHVRPASLAPMLKAKRLLISPQIPKAALPRELIARPSKAKAATTIHGAAVGAVAVVGVVANAESAETVRINAAAIPVPKVNAARVAKASPSPQRVTVPNADTPCWMLMVNP